MANDKKEQKTQRSAPTQGSASKDTRLSTRGEASVLIDEEGRTTIYQQVVAKIAGIAVREIDGVRRLVPFGAGQQVSSVARTLTGNEMRDLGVRVEVGAQEAAVDVRIVTDYGVSIPAVAEGIRRNVSARIEEMTGLEVVEVNVDVVDLYFAEEDAEAEPQEAPRVQ